MEPESGVTHRLAVGPGQEKDNRRFGDMLRGWRKTAGMSIDEVAAVLKVSAAYIRLIERGERVPAQDTARHLLKLLGVPHSDSVSSDPVLQRIAPRWDLLIQASDRPGHQYAVNFVSRVSTRRSEGRSLIEERLAEYMANATSSVPLVEESSTPTGRDATVGRIVRLLSQVGLSALERVEVMLKAEAGGALHSPKDSAR